MESLKGVCCLPMTPFTDSGDVDETSMRRLVNHAIAGGVHSLVALGRAGESMYLTMNERRRVMDIVTDQAARRLPLGFGIIDAGFDEGLEVGRHAREVGADFVMSRPPVDGDFREYYRKLTEIVPVVVYDEGVQAELSIEGDIVPLLRETGNVVGLKISGEAAKIPEAKRLVDVPVLCGVEVMGLLEYQMGADGVTSAAACFLPKQQVRMYQLASENRWDQARDLFYRELLPLLTYFPGGPNKMGWSVCKHILHWKGIIDSPAVRPPSLPATEAHLQEARALLSRLDD